MKTLPKFSERKATEAAVLLLQMAYGRMKYIRLLKLLYLSDKRAFFELGRSITNDHYCSMKHGQVPSIAYDLVKGTIENPGGIWRCYINAPVDKYYIELKENPEKIGMLSESESDIIRSVFMENIDKTDFELADLTKSSEYVSVTEQRKSIPTPIEKILFDLKYNEEEIESIKEILEEEVDIQAFFGG